MIDPSSCPVMIKLSSYVLVLDMISTEEKSAKLLFVFTFENTFEISLRFNEKRVN